MCYNTFIGDIMIIINKKGLKRIVNDTVNIINNQYSIQINTYPLTKMEVIEKNKKDLFNNPEKYPLLKIIENYYWNYRAVNISDKKSQNIFIGIDCYNNFTKIHSDKFLVDFYVTVYHEIRHSLQNLSIGIDKYLENIFKIENILIFFSYKYYLVNKNNFLMEIDANEYAVNNVINIFNNIKMIDYLNEKKKRLSLQCKHYNFNQNFDRLKLLVSKYKSLSKDSFISIFFNDDKNYDLNQIIKNESFKSLSNLFQLDIINYYIADVAYLDVEDKMYILNMIDSFNYNDKTLKKFDHLSKIHNIIDKIQINKSFRLK